MKSAIRRPGRTRRTIAAALLIGLPMVGVTACSEDEGDEGGIVEEEGELGEEEIGE